MKSPPNPPPKIDVPRDADLDTPESSRRDVTPSPDTVNIRDEDYPSAGKPLLPGSPTARALQERPPAGDDQLRAGSAGDAARPSKTGIVNPSLPPRP
jgi:hypothetical protein